MQLESKRLKQLLETLNTYFADAALASLAPIAVIVFSASRIACSSFLRFARPAATDRLK